MRASTLSISLSFQSRTPYRVLETQFLSKLSQIAELKVCQHSVPSQVVQDRYF